MSNRNDLPSQSSENFLQRVRETLQTYLGRQGDPLDRGLTLRDLLESGIAQLKPGQTLRPGQAVAPIAPGPAVTDEPDLAPPPTPSGFTVTSAISHVFIEHDPPLYLQGHGHLRTRVYGKAVADGDPLPTFGDAAELAQFSGTVYSLPTNPATTWHLWIKWETRDGVLSVAPAGGVNGLAITTGQDVTLLVDALTGDGNPFAILREPTTIDGVLFPAGIYSQQAFLKDAQVTNAKIANLAVDDAKIANLSVSKLTAGSIAVGEYIQSSGFVSGSAGFRIDGNGNAEFNVGTFRGDVYADDGVFNGTVYASAGSFTGTIFAGAGGTIGGIDIGADFIESTNFATGSAGWQLKADGTAEFGAAAIRGQLTADQINTNGLTIKDTEGTVVFSATVPLAGAYIANAAITTAKIGDAQVNTLKIGTNAVTVPGGATALYMNSSREGASVELTLSANQTVAIIASIDTYDSAGPGSETRALIMRGSTEVGKFHRATQTISTEGGTTYLSHDQSVCLTDTGVSADGTYTYKIVFPALPAGGTGISVRSSIVVIQCKR